MRMTTNQWRPDTCDCVIEFEFDADLPAEEREHMHKSIVPCTRHASVTADSFERLPASEDLDTPNEKTNRRAALRSAQDERRHGHAQHLAALDDNRMKNLIHGRVKEEHPDMADEDFEWSFDEKRNLNFRVKGRSLKAQTLARVAADFGARAKHLG